MQRLVGSKYCDDRGFVSFINSLDLSKYKRFYLVENHEKGFIRAWHGHKHESKAVYCLRGAAKIGIVPINSEDEPEFAVLSAHSPQAVIIPAGYANGAMNLTDDCILMYLSDKNLDESHGDDYRFSWDHWGDDIWKAEFR